MFPTFETTHGKPIPIASRIVIGSPSLSDVNIQIFDKL